MPTRINCHARRSTANAISLFAAYTLLTAVLVPCAGCLPVSATFITVEAARQLDEDRLKAVSVESSFHARGLAREQVVYQVQVRGERTGPIRSTDGRYELDGGRVGARRSILIPTSPFTKHGAVVTIPANEIRIDGKDLPLLADVELYTSDGRLLARGQCRLPIRTLDELRPPLDVNAKPIPDRDE